MNRRNGGALALILVVAAGVFLWREMAARPIRAAAVDASSGIDIDFHMRGVDAGTFVLDIRGGTPAPVDLARVVFVTCNALRDAHPGASLLLARGGEAKFTLSGDDVRELGDDDEQPLYRMRILPVRARPMDGSAGFEDPQGGALYVMQAVAENMTAFAKRWMEVP